MKAIRQILSDRILATAMAVVIAYMVALQGLAGSFARASTISPAEKPFHIICAASGVTDEQRGSAPAPLKKNAECPCALLCRIAGSAAPAILDPLFVPGMRIATIADRPTALKAHPGRPSSPRRLLAEPRAPPPSA